MIVKSGRLYLWKNDISQKELIIKIGTGSSSSEYVEIDQIDLVEEVTTATLGVMTEANFNIWNSTNPALAWSSSILDITDFLFEEERKIIIYVKIVANTAFELGEMGLFVKGVDPEPDVMISRNLMQKQFVSTSESKIIKYTINI